MHISLDEYPTNTSAQTNSNSASASGIIPRPIGRARMLPMLPGIFGASDPGGAVEYQQFVDDFRAQAAACLCLSDLCGRVSGVSKHIISAC